MKHTKRAIKTFVFAAVLGATASASAISASAIPFEDIDPFKLLKSTAEDCTNTYKAYDINDFVMFNLKDGSDFKSAFTNVCKVYGQYESAYMMFAEKNGKTEFIDAQGINEGVVVPNIEEKAKNIIEAQGYKATDMIIGKSRDTKCYIVYFTTADGEYVIPLHDIKWANASFGKEIYDYIKEGKIYTTGEFLAAIREYNKPYEGLIMGDADGNNVVNIRDCALMARAMARHSNDMILGRMCDYNRDGVINVRDCADLAVDIAKLRMENRI